VVELLNGVSQYIQKNEPGTTRYQINVETNKKSGIEEVILLERSDSLYLVRTRLTPTSYKDKAALGAHASSDAFKAFQKALKDEGLIGAPMQIKFVKEAGGFPRL
jgi:quinol monooxygenase YgiN